MAEHQSGVVGGEFRVTQEGGASPVGGQFAKPGPAGAAR